MREAPFARLLHTLAREVVQGNCLSLPRSPSLRIWQSWRHSPLGRDEDRRQCCSGPSLAARSGDRTGDCWRAPSRRQSPTGRSKRTPRGQLPPTGDWLRPLALSRLGRRCALHWFLVLASLVVRAGRACLDLALCLSFPCLVRSFPRLNCPFPSSGVVHLHPFLSHLLSCSLSAALSALHSRSLRSLSHCSTHLGLFSSYSLFWTFFRAIAAFWYVSAFPCHSLASPQEHHNVNDHNNASFQPPFFSQRTKKDYCTSRETSSRKLAIADLSQRSYLTSQ